MSNPLETLYSDIEGNEKSKLDSNKFNQHDQNKRIDLGRLTRLMLVWLVGGAVSLIPDIMVFFFATDFAVAFQDFFSRSNVFVVTTTLTIGVLLEMIFDKKNSNSKYLVIAFQIILIVFCVHVSGLLNSGTIINNIYVIGFTTLVACILVSIIGYVIVCVRERSTVNDKT